MPEDARIGAASTAARAAAKPAKDNTNESSAGRRRQKTRSAPLTRTPAELRLRETAAKAGATAGTASDEGGETPTKRLAELSERIRVCVECPLHASRTRAVPGEGKLDAKFMIVGEAPGRQEDQTGRPFVGSAGKYLDHVLEGTGFHREDFFITNIVKCRPPANRTPKKLEIDTCTSLYLFEQIRLINPELILLLGGVAVKRMLGLKSVEEARGRIIEQEGRKYFATYHPAVRFYREDLAQKIQQDFALLKAELGRIRRSR